MNISSANLRFIKPKTCDCVYLFHLSQAVGAFLFASEILKICIYLGIQ